jgi:hypothetical protein
VTTSIFPRAIRLVTIDDMGETEPALDYAKPVRRAALPWQSLVAIPPMLLTPMLMCGCGHIGWEVLPFTSVSVFLSWWGFHNSAPTIFRVVAIFVVIVATVLFAKNAADILWFGHDALF